MVFVGVVALVEGGAGVRRRVGLLGGGVVVAGSRSPMMGGGWRLPLCAGGALDHRHGERCLEVLVRRLPAAPAGWRWGFGRAGSGWAVWLERIGGAPVRWAVVGLPPGDTAGALAVVLEAYVAAGEGLDVFPL